MATPYDYGRGTVTTAPRPTAPKPTTYQPAPPNSFSLNSAYQAGQTRINDDYAARVADITAQRDPLTAQNNLALSRYNQDYETGTGQNQTRGNWLNQAQATGVGRYGADLRRGTTRIGQDATMQYADTREDMRNRGMTYSTVQDAQLGRDALGFQRQREDLNTQTQRGVQDLNTETQQGLQGIQWNQQGLGTNIQRGREDQAIGYAGAMGGLNSNLSDAERQKASSLYDLMNENAARQRDEARQAYLDKMNAMNTDSVGGAN